MKSLIVLFLAATAILTVMTPRAEARAVAVTALLENGIYDGSTTLDFESIEVSGADPVMSIEVSAPGAHAAATATWIRINQGTLVYTSEFDSPVNADYIGNNSAPGWSYTFVADTDGQFRLDYEVTATDDFGFAWLNANFNFLWNGDYQSINNSTSDQRYSAVTSGSLARDLEAGRTYTVIVPLGGYGSSGWFFRMGWDVVVGWEFDAVEAPVDTEPSTWGGVKSLFR